MQFASVNGVRTEAFPSGRGQCRTCGATLIAKCGPRIVHHWAHAGGRDCDPWWENETDWHREWKNQFPPECREIHHVAPDGEVHRADIKTQTGIYIEVQHSAMTDAERMARENFYGNLVWVIDGRGFRDNFDIYHLLPAPESEIAQDLVWSKAKRHMHGANRGVFFRWSEYLQEHPGASKAEVTSGWIHGIEDIEDQVNQAYRGHHQYDWVKPRRVWLDAAAPVYIDFGDDHLVRLETYDASGLLCIKLVARPKFLHDVMVEARNTDIATRFYPLPMVDGQLE